MGVRSRHPSAAIFTAVSGLLRTVSTCAPVALLEVVPTPAPAAEPAALTADIPAQPVTEALAAFARQTGLQVVYVSEIAHNRMSHGAPAGLAVNAALARLLRGTGLRFEYLTPRSIRILAVAPRTQTPSRAPDGDELHEVIVTANRREQNLQDVPIAIHVLTNEGLAMLNAKTFDDFLSYVPGVTAHGLGPGQNNIYVRGLATGEAAIQSSGVNGSIPNVAVYLDEQSTQVPFRNLDIYAADLERIEILEGPQGTLFGAGAEAGVVRYITNRPKLNATEAIVGAGYATTAHGQPSASVDATLNLPIIADKLALRAVIYNESRGGYINDIPATFARSPNDVGIHYAYAGGRVPVNSVVINNAGTAGDAINPVSYGGVRVQALYQISDDWNVRLAQTYQNIEADGVFAEMTANSLGEAQPDLTAQLYNPSYNKDRFENTALTIEGRIGALRLLYAGAYLVRNVEQVQDYTNYARGPYVDYYQCANPGYQTQNPVTAQCFTPSSTWRDVERNTHQSHELRLGTPDDWRIRGVGGLYFENYRMREQVDWRYLTAIPYFNPIGPPTGYFTVNGSTVLPNGQQVLWRTPGAVFVPSPVTSSNPSIRPADDGFFDDITRGYTQRAAYASVDIELIPGAFTLTVGSRYSSIDATEVGSAVGGFGCQLIFNPTAPNPCVNHSNIENLNAKGFDRTFSGFKSRVNMSWKVTDDALVYYTWSQGFRAGGFNRGHSNPPGSPLVPGDGAWQAQARAHGGWVPALDYAPDTLTNNEVGWKTRWLDHRIQWNGAVYQEEWNHVQTGIAGNIVLGGQTAGINGADYRVRGIETAGMARIATGLTLEISAAWNHSELVKEAVLLWADGTPIDFGALQLQSGEKILNPLGARGSPLAGSPSFQGNVRARYEFPVDGYDAFVQIGAVHQSHSLASTDRMTFDLQGNSAAYELPPFTMYDGALGVSKNAWIVQVYGQNLTDSRADLYTNYRQWYKAVTVSRPRTIGLRLSYRFAGS